MSTDLWLALSGGGLRATLFHLGVIAALRKLKRLEDVRVISCVSGGSIAGAHLVLNWERFVGKEDDFEAAASQLIQFAKQDVRGRIIRRLPRRRHSTFESCLDDYLFFGALLSSISQDKDRLLVLNTTDIKHGAAAAFVGNNFLPDVRRPTKENGGPASFDVGPFSLASAVACSAGFPALFPAREISARDFAQARKTWEAGASLSDGGIYDNLGIQFFLGLSGTATPTELLVSDAGAPFDYSVGAGGNILSRVSRITNVQMELLRSAVIADATAAPLKPRLISIADEPSLRRSKNQQDVLAGVPPPEIVRQLQFIRTDLNQFSELEIDLLIRHGFTVAFNTMTGSLAPTPSVSAVWSPINQGPPPDAAQIQAHSETLAKSQKRQLGIFNARDRTFPVPWLLIFIGLACMGVLAQIVLPFVSETLHGPLLDNLITGRPYRLQQVMRYVVLEPASDRGERRSIRGTSRIFYWLRFNRAIRNSESTFSEVYRPTYERGGSVHGLGVIGADATRESPGTQQFEVEQELAFEGARGDIRLVGTGLSYEFDWPGPKRSLDQTNFDAGGDYWAYDNTEDYIDRLEIVIESRSERLIVSQRPRDCAILYRANGSIEQSSCRTGENSGIVRPELPLYGGALIAEFRDLKPGDEAIIKYEIVLR